MPLFCIYIVLRETVRILFPSLSQGRPEEPQPEEREHSSRPINFGYKAAAHSLTDSWDNPTHGLHIFLRHLVFLPNKRESEKHKKMEGN